MIKNIACVCFFLCLLLVCISDIKYRKIPNKYLIFLLGFGFIFHPSGNYIFALLVFAVGFVSYYLKKLGAGDVKLAFVLALLVSPGQESIFMIYFSVSVFSFLILIIALSRLMENPYWKMIENIVPINLPYINRKVLHTLPFGVPISLSFLFYYLTCYMRVLA